MHSQLNATSVYEAYERLEKRWLRTEIEEINHWLPPAHELELFPYVHISWCGSREPNICDRALFRIQGFYSCQRARDVYFFASRTFLYIGGVASKCWFLFRTWKFKERENNQSVVSLLFSPNQIQSHDRNSDECLKRPWVDWFARLFDSAKILNLRRYFSAFLSPPVIGFGDCKRWKWGLGSRGDM